MVKDKRGRESHFLVLPLPLQGHINPMLQFSKRLESKGLKVTLIVTPYIAESMQGQHSSINLEPVFDGSKEGEMAANIDKYFERYKIIMPHSLSNLIDRYNGSEYPVKFLVYDSVLPWALDVARNKGIEGGPFFTQSCAVTAVLYHAAQGSFQVPVDESDQAAVSLPSLEKLELNDLPSFATDASSYPAIRELLLGQFSNILEARWLIWNSFNELEVVDWMRINKWSMIKPVGPMIPSMFLDKRLGDDKDYGLNLIKPNSDVCMKWLDSKEPGWCVGEEQMAELAWGLKRSNRCFLWIVRESEEIGCFVTHCGWNSTLEALSLGVPMVAMPQWTDQPTNAKYITDVWRVGVRVKANEKGIVTKEEVERCIREVLESETSNAIRGNSDKWRKLAKIAVDEGGSSDKNIEEFVAEVACKSKGIIE
uniref:Glycosyltransferase n=1 Tax=Salix viminalis TaxID=40686 RepID=A0A6N2LHL0_SALVM